ncbi:MAG TPA: peptidase M50, partial [Myxococcaceae bacterium]|nr:peptidase M50 [Myxococcaceae bacterium]
MLRFRLGSISVVVHPVHFLFALVLGTYWIRNSPEVPQVVALAIWVVIVFVSVLFHELGHALAFRAFGYASTVQLVALGGMTTPATDRPLTWGKVVVSTLAGPFFGASLGLLCGVLARAATPGSIEEYALRTAAGTNMVWAIFNLLPIVPLDG